MADFRTYRTVSGRSLAESGLKFGAKVLTRIGVELYRENTETLEESLPLVPVDTGALRGSGYVSQPEIAGTHVTSEVGYGGVATKINPKTLEPTTTYALIVHENLEAHHEVGQAKYLQVPFDAKIEGMGQRIAAGLKRQDAGVAGMGTQDAPPSGDGK